MQRGNNVQRRFNKAIFPKLSYSERLVRLHLPTLEMRLLMADLTTCYKLLNGLIDIDSSNFFVASTNTQTRGNSCKLKKNYILNIRDADMFNNWVINVWNKLPDSVVLAASISSFKRRLSSFVVNVGFEHFSANYIFIFSLRYCRLLLLLTVFWAPVSGGCILPWCPVQCLLYSGQINWLIDWLIDLKRFCDYCGHFILFHFFLILLFDRNLHSLFVETNVA